MESLITIRGNGVIGDDKMGDEDTNWGRIILGVNRYIFCQMIIAGRKYPISIWNVEITYVWL